MGLRNLLVRDYARIELTVLARTIRHDLADLREFATLAAERIAD